MQGPPLLASIPPGWLCNVSRFCNSEQSDVRFTPESGHVRCKPSCLLWAKSGHGVAHSITSSAVNKSFGGMVKSIALAVCKLITNSYLVGC